MNPTHQFLRSMRCAPKVSRAARVPYPHKKPSEDAANNTLSLLCQKTPSNGCEAFCLQQDRTETEPYNMTRDASPSNPHF